MQLTSSAFKLNQPIPAKYTCKGDDINPPLAITDVPSDAKCLALIVHDPDAPAGDWLHWLVWNIDPDCGHIDAGSLPMHSVEGSTDFGKPGWGGPCPPSGIHHYFFELYALDTMLDLPFGASRQQLEQTMQPHIVDKTELVGTFSS